MKEKMIKIEDGKAWDDFRILCLQQKSTISKIIEELIKDYVFKNYHYLETKKQGGYNEKIKRGKKGKGID